MGHLGKPGQRHLSQALPEAGRLFLHFFHIIVLGTQSTCSPCCCVTLSGPRSSPWPAASLGTI